MSKPRMTKEDYEKYGSYDNKLSQGRKPDQKIHIEGIGTIEVYGKWPVEKMIKKLLTYKEITGG